MLCERYQEALIEAAASSDSLPLDLRSHVDACDSCRTALERERLLCASIDAGIRQAANADVPPSLLPVLRVRLAQEASPKRFSTANWIYAAVAVALILALLPVLRPRNTAVERVAEEKARQLPTEQKAPSQLAHSAPPVAARGVPQNRKPQPRASTQPTPNPEPEVLVPPDERDALERFASNGPEFLDSAVAVVHLVPRQDVDSLHFEPLQIARLEVKPLEPERAGDEEHRDD